MKKRKEVITKKFEQYFHEIHDYINENSPQNAIKFAEQLDKKIDIIKQNPKVYSQERYLPTKKKWYRSARLMKSWKIVYKVTNELLVFLGIIHTSRHPKEIKKLRTSNYD